MNTIKTMAAAIALAILSTTALADDPPQPAGDSREYLEVESLDEAVEAIQKQTFGFPAMIFLLVPGKPQLHRYGNSRASLRARYQLRLPA